MGYLILLLSLISSLSFGKDIRVMVIDTGIDSKHLFSSYTYKHLAIIPFAIGIVILGYYYLYYAPVQKRRQLATQI